MIKKETKEQIRKREKRLAKRELNKAWLIVKKEVEEIQGHKCYICEKEVHGMSSQIHHIIDRRIKELFLDPLNLVLLCPLCHRLGPFAVHQSAIWFSEKLIRKEPERYIYLISKAELYQKK